MGVGECDKNTTNPPLARAGKKHQTCGNVEDDGTGSKCDMTDRIVSMVESLFTLSELDFRKHVSADRIDQQGASSCDHQEHYSSGNAQQEHFTKEEGYHDQTLKGADAAATFVNLDHLLPHDQALAEKFHRLPRKEKSLAGKKGNRGSKVTDQKLFYLVRILLLLQLRVTVKLSCSKSQLCFFLVQH